MNLCIGVEIAKSAYIFNDTMGIFLIGKTAHMRVSMQHKEGKNRKGEKMKSNYLTLNIPEKLVKEWFRGVGAEIVVHCRDCIHYHQIEKWGWKKSCDLFNFDIDEDDFCSRGLKK